MRRAEPFLLAGIFLVFVIACGGLVRAAGGLYLDGHEGDSFHVLDILTRMEAGQVPHLDFVTPLGLLAFWPVAELVRAGQSAGAAFILAQTGVALVLLPVVTYAAATRMSRALGIWFGLVTLGLTLALSYGTSASGVTISMHYNRWAWAITFVILALVLLPALGQPRPRLDGALVGLLGAALLLLKITYFVAVVPVAALALWQRAGARGLAAALIAGALPVALVTLAYGPGFWLAYLADLRLVVGNEFRASGGAPFADIVSAPPFLGATLVGLATALLVRQVTPGGVGLAAVLLIPGLLYITYQNFGNDPQWLLFVPVLLLALRPEAGEGALFGIDLRSAMSVTAVAAFALFFPSFANIALSPVAHLSFDKSRFLPMLPQAAGHQDVYIRADRAYTTTAMVFKDREPGPWSVYSDRADRPPVTEFQGITFPDCEWMSGSRAYFETLGAAIEQAGIPEGSRVFNADLMAALWFFAPVAPPEHSAPWYYGGLTGLQNTDYVTVPKCGFVTGARRIILRELAASDYRFTLVADTEVMALFRVSR